MLGSAIFYRHLAAELLPFLKGTRIAFVYSLSRQELILELEHHQALKFHVIDGVSFLVPIPEFHRPADGCLPRFNAIHGLKILDVQVVPFDRAIRLELEKGYGLFFKMYGSRANLILFKDGVVQDIYLKNLSKDWDFQWEQSGKQAPDFEQGSWSLPELGQQFKYITAETLRTLAFLGYENNPANAFHLLINEKLQWGISTAGIYPWGMLSEQQGPYALLSEANWAFYRLFSHRYFLEKERSECLQHLLDQQRKLEYAIRANHQAIAELHHKPGPEEQGHLLMSHLHLYKSGAVAIKVQDYFNGGEFEIKLNPELDGVQNAEAFYRRAKKQKEQELQLQQRENQLHEQQQVLQQRLELVTKTENIKELRRFRKQFQKEEEHEPFKRFQYRGFTILVGKNAVGNDLITRQAHKNDLWLHARDVPGSHVIIKQKPGASFPVPVIERAASLAAYYSKLRNESVAAVIYTEKKYVRKPKGAAPGLVRLERESGVMVRPEP